MIDNNCRLWLTTKGDCDSQWVTITDTGDCWPQEEPELEHCPACLRTVKEGDKVHIFVVFKLLMFLWFSPSSQTIFIEIWSQVQENEGKRFHQGCFQLCAMFNITSSRNVWHMESKSTTHWKHFVNYHNQASAWQQDWLSHSLEASGVWNIIIKDHSPTYLSTIF